MIVLHAEVNLLGAPGGGGRYPSQWLITRLIGKIGES